MQLQCIYREVGFEKKANKKGVRGSWLLAEWVFWISWLASVVRQLAHVERRRKRGRQRGEERGKKRITKI